MTGAREPYEPYCANTVAPELKAFIDRVVVPALLERFLREQSQATTPKRPAA